MYLFLPPSRILQPLDKTDLLPFCQTSPSHIAFVEYAIIPIAHSHTRPTISATPRIQQQQGSCCQKSGISLTVTSATGYPAHAFPFTLLTLSALFDYPSACHPLSQEPSSEPLLHPTAAEQNQGLSFRIQCS